MMRSMMLLCCALLLGVAGSTPVRVSLQLGRTSFDLLDPVAIRIVADNPRGTPISERFLAPTEYAIEISSQGAPIWSSAPASPSPIVLPGHTRTLLPGATVLATYAWDGLRTDGTSPAPGSYTVHVRLLTAEATPVAKATVRFIAPIPISALAKLHVGDEVTIGGRLDATGADLTDSTGSVTLSHRIPHAPATPIVVRGFISKTPSGSIVFGIERWAPLAGGIL